MKILNFGSCNIDYVYKVDHITLAGETISSEKLDIFPGGKGLNQSIAAARAGAPVYHAGCIGNDGDMLKDILSESGVNITYLKRVDEKNGHAIIQVDKNAENCIFLYKGSNDMVTTEYIDKVLADFGCDDYLLLQNEISNVDYLVKKAHKIGMKIVLNPSPFNDALKKINLKHITYLILNEVEASEFSNQKEPEKILESMKSLYPDLKIMLTLGKKGCIYSDKDITLSHPSFCVNAVDTTAAGDTFTGYFLCAVSEGRDYEYALKFASAASALAVSKKGAAPSIPLKNEVTEAMEQLTPSASEKDKKAEIIHQVNKYIDENISTARLDVLAQMLGYSSSHMGIVIKNYLGVSFSVLLQQKRCKAAAKLFEETDIPVEDIIVQVGYENKTYFRQLFKDTYGMLPLEYRKLRKK